MLLGVVNPTQTFEKNLLMALKEERSLPLRGLPNTLRRPPCHPGRGNQAGGSRRRAATRTRCSRRRAARRARSKAGSGPPWAFCSRRAGTACSRSDPEASLGLSSESPIPQENKNNFMFVLCVTKANVLECFAM